MSRFLKIMIVLLTIAAVATPVMAEDRLSLGGQMRVRGFYLDDGKDNNDNTATFVDQRLRIGGKLNVAEGVSITFRFDETEGKWGTRNANNENRQGVRFIESETGMQWDRAHLDLDFGTFQLRAGQAYFGAGLTTVIDTQDAGIQLVAGPVKGFFVLDSNNGGTNNSDNYLAGLVYSQKIENIKFEIIGGMEKQTETYYAKDESAADGDTPQSVAGKEVYLIGANVVASFDALTLSGEFDYFTGDAATDVDAMGTQLYVKADLATSETVHVGAQGFYALAADDDEVQISYLGNSFGDWKPLTQSGVSSMSGEVGSHYTHPFSQVFKNAGLIGLNVYSTVKVNDALAIGGAASYLMPEDDDMAPNDADSAIQLVVDSSYKLLTNAYLDATLQYTDVDDNTDNDAEIVAGMGLFVNF